MRETQVRSLGQEHALEKGMAMHLSIFTWRIPWTEESGGLQFMAPQESDTTEVTACMHAVRTSGHLGDLSPTRTPGLATELHHISPSSQGNLRISK